MPSIHYCYLSLVQLLFTHTRVQYRNLRLAEMVRQYSRESELVVMTLPLPRRGQSPALYTAWLDMISKDMPPTLFIRGNQQPVLTFFSWTFVIELATTNNLGANFFFVIPCIELLILLTKYGHEFKNSIFSLYFSTPNLCLIWKNIIINQWHKKHCITSQLVIFDQVKETR